MQNVQLINFSKKIQKSFLYSFARKTFYICAYPFSAHEVDFDIDAAYHQLCSSNPQASDSTCLRTNDLKSNFTYDLKIIVPAYNCEKYIKECIESIINQKTSYNFELIVVDDGSTDNTAQIIDEFVGIDNVKILHEQNGGVSHARNIGLQTLDAKYIAFIDSDDVLPENAIEALLSAAFKTDSDIVEGSHYRLYNNELTKSKIHTYNISANGSDLIGMPWGKVYKSSLFENIIFPEGIWFEDTICCFLLYTKANKICTIPDFVYTYRIITSSVSHSSAKNLRSIDTLWVTQLVLSDYTALSLPKDRNFHNKVMRQIIVNYKRLRKLSPEIQKSAFVLTSDTFQKYCKTNISDKKYHQLEKALLTGDFGRYNLFCKTH